MRDINITTRAADGTATFSIKNIGTVEGMEILAHKVTKAILQQTKTTPVQNYIGADAFSLAHISCDSTTLNATKLQLTSVLKTITDQIIADTPSIAPNTARIQNIVLDDLFYNYSNHQLYLKIRIYPVAGQSQLLSFPIDDRKW